MAFVLVLALAVLGSIGTESATTPEESSTSQRPHTTTLPQPTVELIAKKSIAGEAVRVWWDKGGFSKHDFVCYEPHRPTTDWKAIGQRGQGNHDALETFIYLFRDDSLEALKMPIAFEFIWDDRGSIMNQDGSVWRVKCSPGYVAVGDFFYQANRVDSPGSDLYFRARCVREDLTEACEFGHKIWDDSRSFASKDVSVWETLGSERAMGGFLYANGAHEHPPNITPNCLKKSAFKEDS